jgi:hypothetical protein
MYNNENGSGSPAPPLSNWEVESRRKSEIRGPILKRRDAIYEHCKSELIDIANEMLGEKLQSGNSFVSKAYGLGNTTEVTPADILSVYSQFVERFFELDSSEQRKLFEMLYYLPGGEIGAGSEAESFKLNIFQTRIRNKLTGQVYILYYSQYNRKGKHYKNIVNIVPEGIKILPSGLYSKYVPCAPYVYKMFDYSHQCDLRMGGNTCERYKFIGNEFTNLWPLPKLRNINGGKRSKTIKKKARKGTRRVFKK